MFIKPCNGRVTSSFGPRIHPVTGAKGTIHNGVDYGNTPTDNRIFAAADGKVSRVQRDGTFGTYGNLVMIVHNIGGKTYETVYAHLASINVSVGQLVKCGQVIGIKGTTGGSTGIHLHFEIHVGRWNNKYSNAKNPIHFVIDPDVIVLQGLLVKAGYQLTVDGIAGPATDAAVRTFQKIKGLVVDGSVGPLTIAALEKGGGVIVDKEVAKEVEFSSPTLKKEIEASLASKAHRQIIVEAAVKAGAHLSWKEKLENKTITDGDLLYLSVKYLIAVNK